MIRSNTFSHRRTVFIAVGCIALAIIGVLLIVSSKQVRQLAGGVAARLTVGSRPINILLIANNARGLAADNPLGLGSAAGQADVILLAHVDPSAHAIFGITIPRDALIAQPRWHNTVPKIKTLFFMGNQETPPHGPQYLTAAVSRLTGMPIDGYLVANFAGFKKAVDLVGGLTINVKERLYDPQNSHADFRPGSQHMNGGQVLAYIRVRQNQAGNSYRVNDYQRMQAEVEVLGLLRDKLLDPRRAGSLVPTFVTHMKGDIATNLSQDKLVRLGIAMAGAPVYQVALGSIADSMVLAGSTIQGINREGRIDEAAYDVLDVDQIKKQLAQFGSRSSTAGLPVQPRPESLRVRLYGSDHMVLHLQHLGFHHVLKAGEPTGANEVVYPAMQPAAGWLVARSVGTGNVFVRPGDGEDIVVYE